MGGQMLAASCLSSLDRFSLVPTLLWRMAFCFVFLAKISKTRSPDKTPIIKPSQLWPRKIKMTKNKQKFGVREETERNFRAQLTFSFPSVLLGKGAMWPAAANSCCLPRHENGTFKLGARIRPFFFYCFYFFNYLIMFTHFIWGQCTGASHACLWGQRQSAGIDSFSHTDPGIKLRGCQVWQQAFYLMTLFGGPTALLCQVSGHKSSNYYTPAPPALCRPWEPSGAHTLSYTGWRHISLQSQGCIYIIKTKIVGDHLKRPGLSH